MLSQGGQVTIHRMILSPILGCMRGEVGNQQPSSKEEILFSMNAVQRLDVGRLLCQWQGGLRYSPLPGESLW